MSTEKSNFKPKVISSIKKNISNKAKNKEQDFLKSTDEDDPNLSTMKYEKTNLSSELFLNEKDEYQMENIADSVDFSVMVRSDDEPESIHFGSQNIKLKTSSFQGDQNEGKFQEQFNMIKEENVKLQRLSASLKNKIESLQIENGSIKKMNQSLIMKGEGNSIQQNSTVEILRKKIAELNAQVMTQKGDIVERDISIRRLRGLIQEMQKERKSDSKFSSNESRLNEINSHLKDGSSGYPVLKINYESEYQSHSIKVLCRVKPVIKNCLRLPSNDTIHLPSFKHFDKGLAYRMNRVFGVTATQEDIFKEIKGILPSCFTGSNVCVLTYGQSGSGKTHTMIGSEKDPGIMFLSMNELINITREAPSPLHRFHLTILEIYNESIYDLMSKNLEKTPQNINSKVVLQDNGHSVQIKDISEAEIEKETEFSYFITQSLKRRSSSMTARNMNSSRSHFLVMIRITSGSSNQEEINKGSLIMCDLAGSENCNGQSDKEQSESKYINRSITMLNRVFDAMYRKLSSIPFRDSKLTHLLKPSLMGNAKCVFIATVCGQIANIHDTHRTLNVAKKVGMIQFNNP